MEIHIPVNSDDGQAYQDDISIQPDHHLTYAIPTSHAVLPHTFSPQKHRPYAALEPLERAIMKYMCHHRNHSVLITDLAQTIQASCGCTELQFKWVLPQLHITKDAESEVSSSVWPSRHYCQRLILPAHLMMGMWSLRQDTERFTRVSAFVILISDVIGPVNLTAVIMN